MNKNIFLLISLGVFFFLYFFSFIKAIVFFEYKYMWMQLILNLFILLGYKNAK